jgi:hypothetical protein
MFCSMAGRVSLTGALYCMTLNEEVEEIAIAENQVAARKEQVGPANLCSQFASVIEGWLESRWVSNMSQN